VSTLSRVESICDEIIVSKVRGFGMDKVVMSYLKFSQIGFAIFRWVH